MLSDIDDLKRQIEVLTNPKAERDYLTLPVVDLGGAQWPTKKKPTLELARAYVAKLQDITGAMVEGKQLKDNHTPADIWKIVHEQLGNVDSLIEIAQKQLREI